MISIRKQLFTIFLTIGTVMIFFTSMIVNVVIRENFELYINNNITQVGDTILDLVQNAYNEGTLDEDVVRASIVENPMGNFAVSILNKNKEFMWGMNKEEFFYQLQNEMEEGQRKIDYDMYQEVDRPYYGANQEIVGYVRIGYYPSDVLSSNDKKFQSNVKVSLIWCSSMMLMWFVFAGLYISRLFTCRLQRLFPLSN